MAGAIRLVSIEKGFDPKRFAFMPFGGGGALHTGALIKEVGLGPRHRAALPGVTSALGCVVADMRHDRVQTSTPARRSSTPQGAGRGDGEARADETLLAGAGVAFEAYRPGVRIRHALSRPDPYGQRAGGDSRSRA
jgi:N-methylhydantoinase A